MLWIELGWPHTKQMSYPLHPLFSSVSDIHDSLFTRELKEDILIALPLLYKLRVMHVLCVYTDHILVNILMLH